MTRGGRLFAAAAVLALVGCGAEAGKLEVRSTPSPLSAGSKPVPFRIAEGRAQLALGNAALALESFRKALREDPGATEAMAGIALCYDRMGRFDLSRRHYEAALAISPEDPELLGLFAESLDRQGKRAEAAGIRAEIAARIAAESRPILPVVTAAARSVEPAKAEPVQERPPAGVEARTEPTQVPPAAEPAVAMVGKSITVSLPPAAPQPKEAQSPTVATPATASTQRSAPRLERLSMGEVALVTTPRPIWAAVQLHRDARVDKVRFVPLRQAEAPAVSGIRLLNAARNEGLAARTRAYLAERGWRGMAIGDAPETRARSVVIYPASRRRIGLSLAAQFGFDAVQDARGHEITLLLGRDAVGLRPLRSAG